MATTSNEIKVQINDDVITLTGDALLAFEADRAALVAHQESIEAEIAAKKAAKEAALSKLGLTADEVAALLA